MKISSQEINRINGMLAQSSKVKNDWRIRLINTSNGRKYWVFDLNSMAEIGEFETLGEAETALWKKL